MVTDYRLSYGTHASPDEGRCAMEWVSLLAGEPHSDEPACVSPVLRAFCTTLNDSLEDEPRQRLRPVSRTHDRHRGRWTGRGAVVDGDGLADPHLRAKLASRRRVDRVGGTIGGVTGCSRFIPVEAVC